MAPPGALLRDSGDSDRCTGEIPPGASAHGPQRDEQAVDSSSTRKEVVLDEAVRGLNW